MVVLATALKQTPAQTIKAHRTTIEDSPTQDAWTDCDGLVAIASETSGDMLSLNEDAKTINVLESGLFNFGGCVHYQNNAGGDRRPLVASRLFVNGTTEAKCSQRACKMTSKTGDEEVLSYNGTVNLTAGDTVTLQYYCTDNSIDFISNAVFSDTVAWTIWIKHIGLGV